MHQLPRSGPRSNSAASNRANNPERTNNPRDQLPQRTRSSVELASYTERAAADIPSESSRPALSEDREATKLNQIIQHFHCKAALTICSSRANLPRVSTKNGDIKQNRWFNLVLDDTDVFAEDLAPWKRPNMYEIRPPPLLIEVYLDTLHLAQNQALIILDQNGKEYNVADSLTSYPHPPRNGGRHPEVILERWKIDLGDTDEVPSSELNDQLPNVYKKGVVMFRALYSFARLLPSWKLHRKLTRQAGNHQALRLRFRVKQGHSNMRAGQDPLYAPLCPSEQRSESHVERYQIPALMCRAGPLSIAVEYRTNCDFVVADAEALLSSRLLGLEDGAQMLSAGRSLPGARSEQSRAQYSSLSAGVGDQRARIGAYGSLGTFHGAERRGSPVTELKQRVLDDDSEDDIAKKGRATSARQDVLARRMSVNLVNNPPFKSGSLASSPRALPSPSTSLPRSDSNFARVAGTSSGKRVSLNTLPQQALRAPPENAIASSGSSSPKPAPVHRYSSSFANRNKRFMPGSKAGESNASSGRGSSSSGQKWAGHREGDDELAQIRGNAQPGDSGSSIPSEEDAIASFISDLERAKDLPSLRSRPASRDNTVNLSKYSSMRDPNTQLAEEMSASSLIQTSSTPPSRRLSNVPGLSTSSSPSRALQYTPHVPSRLSTHSIAEEVAGASGASGEGSLSPQVREEEEEDEEPFIFPQDNV